MSWKNLRMIHEVDDDAQDFGMRNETEEAYKEGCKHGFMKALKKLKELGYRIPSELKMHEMGERRMDPEETDYDEEMGMRDGYSYSQGQRGSEGMGERRRRRSNGQWY